MKESSKLELFFSEETWEGTHGSMSRSEPRSLQRSVAQGVRTEGRGQLAVGAGDAAFKVTSSSISRADLAATANKSPSSISLNFLFPDWGNIGVDVKFKFSDVLC